MIPSLRLQFSLCGGIPLRSLMPNYITGQMGTESKGSFTGLGKKEKEAAA
jgi:hypothetical protein